MYAIRSYYAVFTADIVDNPDYRFLVQAGILPLHENKVITVGLAIFLNFNSLTHMILHDPAVYIQVVCPERPGSIKCDRVFSAKK